MNLHFMQPLAFCGKFQVSAFFYHYSIPEEYCNDTVILEEVNFLERATNISKSTVANQAIPGMCTKHFSIGTETMLGDRNNPVVIQIPDNTVVSLSLLIQTN